MSHLPRPERVWTTTCAGEPRLMWAAYNDAGCPLGCYEHEETAWQAMANHGVDVETVRAHLRLGSAVVGSLKHLRSMSRGELVELYKAICREWASGEDRRILGEHRPLPGQDVLERYMRDIEQAGVRAESLETAARL